MRGPRLQQCSIHGAIIVAEQLFHLLPVYQLLQESASAHDLFVEQPLAIFGECRWKPDQIVGAEAHKPAMQNVLV